jgi:Ala-tRNA(Pro) deacylase
MPIISGRLRSFLEKEGVEFETLHHAADFTAQETAAHTGTRGQEFAKVVVVKIDELPAMIVLPAHHRVDFSKLASELGAKDVELCGENELREIFEDCDVGAEPPFGNLYGLPVFLSRAMTDDVHITFNAGSHVDVIRMPFMDYVNLVRPRILDCSAQL